MTATFSEALDPVTLDSGTFSLTGPGNSLVVGTVTYNNRTAAFTPATRLSVASMYTAELSAGITDLVSNPLAASYSWSFSTTADGGVGTWIPTSLTGVPDARQDHVAVWTGTEMIVWGWRRWFDCQRRCSLQPDGQHLEGHDYHRCPCARRSCGCVDRF